MKNTFRIATGVLVLLFLLQFTIRKNSNIIAYGDSITYQQSWYEEIENHYGDQILNCGLGATGVACQSDKYWLVSNNGRGIRHYMTKGQAVWQIV